MTASSQGASGRDDTTTTPPVTLGCASGDAPIVEETAAALVARGYRVERAVGLEGGADTLSAAIDAMDGQGLYVLCRSQRLERTAIDGLRQVLRDRGVPFGRTLTLAVETQTARELEERIVSVLRRMVTGRPEARPAPAAPEPAPAAPEPGPEAVSLPPPPQSMPAASPAPAESVSGAVMPPPYTGADHTAVAIPAPSAASMPLPPPPAEEPSIPSVPTHSAASASMSASASTSAALEPPLTLGGRMGRALSSPTGLLAVVGGVVVILGVSIAVAVSGDDDEDSDDSSTVASNDDAKDKDEAPAKDKDAAPTKADDEAAAEPSDEGAAPSEEPAAVAEPSAPATLAVVRVGDPPPPLPSRDFSANDDPPDVTKALLDREVRAIDVFLVAPERPGTLSYARAETYCGELDVVGLTGWRTPTIGEINAVGAAGMLGNAIYWSATAGDTFGDLRLVLNTKKKRISVVESSWDGAKIVCVRLRQP